MAPMTLPSFLMGIPPAKIMILPSLEAWMPKNWSPDWDRVPRGAGFDVEGARGEGLLLGDIDGAEPGVGHALKGEQIAAGADHGDVHGLADLVGFFGGSGEDAAGVGEVEGFVGSAHAGWGSLGGARCASRWLDAGGRRLVVEAFAEDFDDDAFGALAVELGVEDALPGAEVEATGGDGQGGFVVEKKGFEVGVGVIFAGLVVLVAGEAGGQGFEPGGDVLDEAGLVVVNVDGGGDVHGGNEAQAVGDAGAVDDGFHLVGDVNHFVLLAGVEGKVFGVDGHG